MLSSYETVNFSHYTNPLNLPHKNVAIHTCRWSLLQLFLSGWNQTPMFDSVDFLNTVWCFALSFWEHLLQINQSKINVVLYFKQINIMPSGFNTFRGSSVAYWLASQPCIQGFLGLIPRRTSRFSNDFSLNKAFHH